MAGALNYWSKNAIQMVIIIIIIIKLLERCRCVGHRGIIMFEVISFVWFQNISSEENWHPGLFDICYLGGSLAHTDMFAQISILMP